MHLPPDVERLVDRWVAAELDGVAAELETVLHPDFLFAGPYGYLLDRAEWLSRLTPGTRYHAVATAMIFAADVPARIVGDTALVVGTLAQAGTAQGEPYDGRYRATLVLVQDDGWRIVGLHLSLREPPPSP